MRRALDRAADEVEAAAALGAQGEAQRKRSQRLREVAQAQRARDVTT